MSSNQQGDQKSILKVLLIMLGMHMISCMPVMKMIYGLHDPRYLSDKEVVKFYNHLELDNEIYRVKDYNEDNRKKFRYLGNSMPEVLVFNSSGQLTNYELNCSGGLDSIVGLSVKDIDGMSINQEGKSLQDFTNDTYVVNTDDNTNLSFDKSPVYVVKFGEYAGLLNTDYVPDLVRHLRTRDDIQYIVLNMDYTVKK